VPTSRVEEKKKQQDQCKLGTILLRSRGRSPVGPGLVEQEEVVDTKDGCSFNRDMEIDFGEFEPITLPAVYVQAKASWNEDVSQLPCLQGFKVSMTYEGGIEYVEFSRKVKESEEHYIERSTGHGEHQSAQLFEDSQARLGQVIHAKAKIM
jgi:hypothetical protein